MEVHFNQRRTWKLLEGNTDLKGLFKIAAKDPRVTFTRDCTRTTRPVEGRTLHSDDCTRRGPNLRVGATKPQSIDVRLVAATNHVDRGDDLLPDAGLSADRSDNGPRAERPLCDSAPLFTRVYSSAKLTRSSQLTRKSSRGLMVT
jgi:hypothetical protein